MIMRDDPNEPLDVLPGADKLPDDPDYTYKFQGVRYREYYRRGLYSYDVIVKGVYMGTIQSQKKDDREFMIKRARIVYPRLKSVKDDDMAFQLFGHCALKFPTDKPKKTKVKAQPPKDTKPASILAKIGVKKEAKHSAPVMTVSNTYAVQFYPSVDSLRIQLDSSSMRIENCAMSNRIVLSKGEGKFKRVAGYYVFFSEDDYVKAIEILRSNRKKKYKLIVVLDESLCTFNTYPSAMEAERCIGMNEQTIRKNCSLNLKNIAEGLPLTPTRDKRYICYAESDWRKSVRLMNQESEFND